MPTLRILCFVEDGKEKAILDRVAKSMGVETPEQAVESFGETAHYKTLQVKEPAKRVDMQIKRECMGDDLLMDQKRFSCVVLDWSGFATPCNEESYLNLPGWIADVIDATLAEHLRPGIQNPFFTRGLMRIWKESVTENASA